MKKANRKSNKINNKENEMKTTSTRTRTRNKNANVNADSSALKEGAQIEKDQPLSEFDRLFNKSVEKQLASIFVKQKDATSYDAAHANECAKRFFAEPFSFVPVSDGVKPLYNCLTVVYDTTKPESDDAYKLALLKVAASMFKRLHAITNKSDDQTNAARRLIITILKRKAAQIASAAYNDGSIGRVIDIQVVDHNVKAGIYRVCVGIALIDAFIKRITAEGLKCTAIRQFCQTLEKQTGIRLCDLTPSEQRELAFLCRKANLKGLETFVYNLMDQRDLSWGVVRAVLLEYQRIQAQK